jgi:hypothetical protein
MTQSEFIKKYCETSGITEKELNDIGSCAVFCDCGDCGCEGWAMVGKGNLKSHIDLYLNKI